MECRRRRVPLMLATSVAVSSTHWTADGAAPELCNTDLARTELLGRDERVRAKEITRRSLADANVEPAEPCNMQHLRLASV